MKFRMKWGKKMPPTEPTAPAESVSSLIDAPSANPTAQGSVPTGATSASTATVATTAPTTAPTAAVGNAAGDDDDFIIDLRGIVKTFNEGLPGETTVLHGVNFQVRRGEFVAVVGASGSGKSTLMNIVGMLDKPTSGTYHYAGQDVLTMNDDEAAHHRGSSFGFVFQNFNLIPRISAAQNVEMPMLYQEVPAGERRRRAIDLLTQVGMGERVNFNPTQLSGGQKQRVAIARSLANNPDVIVADEPTGALDTATGRLVMDIFHYLHSQGKTIVFITHNPELAEETDRTVVIADGRIASGALPGFEQSPDDALSGAGKPKYFTAEDRQIESRFVPGMSLDPAPKKKRGRKRKDAAVATQEPATQDPANPDPAIQAVAAETVAADTVAAETVAADAVAAETVAAETVIAENLASDAGRTEKKEVD